MTELRRALVVSTGKNSAWISIDDESGLRLAQLRRAVGKRSMPVPGDVVHVRVLEDGRAVVDRMEERRSTLERQTGGRTKTLAANVDMLVTVTALADPPPRLGTLDQLLAFAEREEIAALVVFTKPDRAGSEERDRLVGLYRGLGYNTIVLNPKAAENLEALRAAIRDRHALLAGVSGVGKSTIFRALGGQATVGELSRFGMGRQTTTAARLYRIEAGFLIDSPGLNEFGLGGIGPAELAEAFREIRGLAAGCRFTDCTHGQEPNCAVRAAVLSGAVAASRYDSYRNILLEAG